MTLPPHRIGDKGQRYEVRYRDEDDAIDVRRTIGWSNDLAGAEGMAAAWRLRPSAEHVWIVDRQPESKPGEAK